MASRFIIRRGEVLNFVQSAITIIGFPQSFADNQDALGNVEEWLADLDALFGDSTSDHRDPIFWTAPRWMMQGDILFFYLTKSSEHNLKKLAIKLDEEPQSAILPRRLLAGHRMRRFRSLLEEAIELSEKYSGTIFACAEVTGSAEFIPPSPDPAYSLRFKSNVFVPLYRVHIFDEPLTSDELASFVRIKQGALVPLHGKTFQGVKGLLTGRNELPDYLENAAPATEALQGSLRDDWVELARRKDVRFVDELQFRDLWIDSLLEELKDLETPLPRECRCFYWGKWRKETSDYFVKVHGSWIPVEAKLNVLSEPKILKQVGHYTRAQSFKPTQGDHRGELFERKPKFRHDVCLIVDQSGIYLASSKGFLGCSPGKPIWRREELDHSVIQTIRDRIREVESCE